MNWLDTSSSYSNEQAAIFKEQHDSGGRQETNEEQYYELVGIE